MNQIESYHYNRVISVLFLVILSGVGPISSVNAQQTFKEITVNKPRVIVLTDIGNEPDDQESMVRFLTYSNEFDIEGLIATTSTHLENTVNPDVIKKLAHAYGEVRSNLAKNAQNYPTEQYLLSRVKAHFPVFGMQGVGKGKDSEGSQLIINTVDEADSHLVWITVWGGASCLAQALWEVRRNRSPAEVAKFVSKLRVYTISDQDDAGIWIRNNFPDLFYIVSASASSGSSWYYRATWTGISGDRFYQNGPMYKFEMVDNPWLEKNIINKHGPLGADYPPLTYIMEGDTPSFLGLIRNGLGWVLSPTYGGWGGRYQLAQTFGETREIWTNTRNSRDRVVVNGRAYVSDQATIWRWRDDFQNDFAARMDWCVKPYDETNHNPKAVVNGHDGKDVLSTSVVAGDTVSLSAADSSDPDGDKLQYHWWVYPEAGTTRRWWIYSNPGAYPGDVQIENSKSADAKVFIPANYMAKNNRRPKQDNAVHVILEITDNGNPALSSYRRVILNVEK